MEYLKLIGIVIIVVGFVLKRDTLAVVVVAGVVTGLVAGLSPLELLNLLGQSFTDQRVATLFILTLPVVGICERYGLKHKAVDLIGSVKNATTGTVLSLYQLIRAVAIAFSVQLGGHPQFVRPLISPMAEGASEAKLGSLSEKQRDSIKGGAAAADNFGNFFAQNLFLGAPGVLLIVATMAEQGYTQVTPLSVALWSIPVAVVSLIFGLVRNILLDRRLRASTPSTSAPESGEGSVKA
ncbi:DUF969 domain-containing protein [Dermabacter sp. p3-SID358]|uniref:DUF969 domain-containing protein n=1 Tax=Dermabacter sp. p3-SID358 TaxID=2916114 RepID=UPI0021A28CFD|nr:DUF969 domain-containing protein [Dermabacter sp. p3-SID358]MCT1867026.1 DUF969 domain-containing protein [Dermabacter sp. p3-SID358]